jgi:hypothetical protein
MLILLIMAALIGLPAMMMTVVFTVRLLQDMRRRP